MYIHIILSILYNIHIILYIHQDGLICATVKQSIEKIQPHWRMIINPL